jgi:hypothetical protein
MARNNSKERSAEVAGCERLLQLFQGAVAGLRQQLLQGEERDQAEDDEDQEGACAGPGVDAGGWVDSTCG